MFSILRTADFSCILNTTHSKFIKRVATPRRHISEAETRKELIDPQLDKAGWYLRDKTKVGREIDLLEQNPFTAIVARYERLGVQMSEAERRGEGLFESMLVESFG